jgi:hypothetical protein
MVHRHSTPSAPGPVAADHDDKESIMRIMRSGLIVLALAFSAALSAPPALVQNATLMPTAADNPVARRNGAENVPLIGHRLCSAETRFGPRKSSLGDDS